MPWAHHTILAGFIAVMIVGGSAVKSVSGEGQPIVAVASSLRLVFPALLEMYHAQTGTRLRVVYGASGSLRFQILKGAPFVVFLSADKASIDALSKAGMTDGSSSIYAVGRLVLFSPFNSQLDVAGDLSGLRLALANGQLRHLAIANPSHAPYGQRAREALRHAGLWRSLQSRLLVAENIAQAAQFAASGNADGGLIARSLASSPQLKAIGRFEVIPSQWHTPINQHMVILNTAGPIARRFAEFMLSDAVRDVLVQYGFDRPG